MDKNDLLDKIAEIKKLAASNDDQDLIAKIHELEDQFADSEEEGTAWGKVLKARHVERPSTLDYIARISDSYMELFGDRYFGDDQAMVGGIATIDGMSVTFIGHQKGSNMRENIKRNYGMSSPEGYRKALRLAKQAEKFNRPVITFIDTPGAYPGMGSEERGISEAIALNLREFSVLKTPIICFVIGEGGSGGAIGIGVADKMYMLENSVYSVITPEGFASILLRDATKAKYAASIMKITAQDINEFGIINGIIPEPNEGIHNNVDQAAKEIKKIILRDLRKLTTRHPEQLVRYRSKKIRNIGHISEKTTTEQLFSLFSKIPWLKNFSSDAD